MSVKGSGKQLRLGIFSAFLGIKPVAIQIRDTVLVGYDEVVAAVDLASVSPKFDVPLMGAFYYFVALDDSDHVIIVFELGLIKLSVSGQKAWTLETDIIEGVERNSDRLVLKRMGNPKPILISIDSGKIIENA